jgi:nicotinamide mononucleotide (NMN) deamidase PncC
MDADCALNSATAQTMAQKTREQAEAGVGLAIVGFPGEKEGAYTLFAHAAVAGEGIERVFSWEMGGDLFTLQQRGAVIGLNTLRLSLLDSNQQKP